MQQFEAAGVASSPLQIVPPKTGHQEEQERGFTKMLFSSFKSIWKSRERDSTTSTSSTKHSSISSTSSFGGGGGSGGRMGSGGLCGSGGGAGGSLFRGPPSSLGTITPPPNSSGVNGSNVHTSFSSSSSSSLSSTSTSPKTPSPQPPPPVPNSNSNSKQHRNSHNNSPSSSLKLRCFSTSTSNSSSKTSGNAANHHLSYLGFSRSSSKNVSKWDEWMKNLLLRCLRSLLSFCVIAITFFFCKRVSVLFVPIKYQWGTFFWTRYLRCHSLLHGGWQTGHRDLPGCSVLAGQCCAVWYLLLFIEADVLTPEVGAVKTHLSCLDSVQCSTCFHVK